MYDLTLSGKNKLHLMGVKVCEMTMTMGVVRRGTVVTMSITTTTTNAYYAPCTCM
jgi:hypothetical protein